ncbi:MAG: hypothetical protein ACIPMY_04575 [Rickettsia endosymbiont of Pentastiridius leporinus]
MNEKDISSTEEDLSVNSDADDASSNSASATGNDMTSERPRHDALIRKALENCRSQDLILQTL